MTDLNRLAADMQDLLTSTADALARDCGFVRRRRKVSGSNFAQALVFAALAEPLPTGGRLRAVAALIGLDASRQAITKRLDARAADFLRRLLAVAVTRAVTSTVAIPLLRRFTSVVVRDSTVVPLPAALAETYRGGNSRTAAGPTAAVKLTVGLDLASGALLGPELGDGRAGDLASGLAQAGPPPGGLQVADLNYFCLAKFARWQRAGASWLSRLKCKTAVFDEDGRRVELVSWLRAAGEADVDRRVVLGGQARRECRLIARRVPERVAELRRRRLREKAADRGGPVSPVALALCDWTILVTDVPPEKLSVEEAMALGRMRWQIELLFKLWKSGAGGIHRWSATRPDSVLCQLYAKLLAQVVRHWVIVAGAWSHADRSVTKAAHVVRMMAMSLALAMRSPRRLAGVLRAARRLMGAVAHMERRKAHPNAHDMILCLGQSP